MKKIIAGIMILASMSSFAQIITVDDSIYAAIAKLTKSHTESSGVEQLKQEIEQKYGVKCEGSSSTVFPDISKQVKYSAVCKGETEMKLTIKSKFKATKDSYEFNVKSYAVEL